MELVVVALGFAILGLYFLPTAIAERRRHRNWHSIAIINFFVGWTVIGWFILLLWAIHRSPGEPSSAPAADLDVKKCPYCAETINREAVKCRYCGSELKVMAGN